MASYAFDTSRGEQEFTYDPNLFLEPAAQEFNHGYSKPCVEDDQTIILAPETSIDLNRQSKDVRFNSTMTSPTTQPSEAHTGRGGQSRKENAGELSGILRDEFHLTNSPFEAFDQLAITNGTLGAEPEFDFTSSPLTSWYSASTTDQSIPDPYGQYPYSSTWDISTPALTHTSSLHSPHPTQYIPPDPRNVEQAYHGQEYQSQQLQEQNLRYFDPRQVNQTYAPSSLAYLTHHLQVNGPTSTNVPDQQMMSVRAQQPAERLLAEAQMTTHAPRQQSRKDRQAHVLRVERGLHKQSYKWIKEHYKSLFHNVQVSTLRGRWRTISKPKSQRPRRPPWNQAAFDALFDRVFDHNNGHHARDKAELDRIPWKRVAAEMTEQFGTHHYGNSTVKAKYKQIYFNVFVGRPMSTRLSVQSPLPKFEC